MDGASAGFKTIRLYLQKKGPVLDAVTLDNLLFLDIETVSEKATYQELSALGQKLWLDKFAKTAPDCQDIPAAYPLHA